MSLELPIEAGILTPPACYANEQERINAFASSLKAILNSLPEWFTGSNPPPTTDLYWMKTDVNGRPVTILKYSNADGAWERLLEIPTFCQTTTGSGAAYQVVNSPAYTTDAAAYYVGKTYVCIANHASVGPSTFQVDGLSVKNIKLKATADIDIDNIIANQVIILTYDGVNMQLAYPNLTVKNILTILTQVFYETASNGYQSMPILGGSVVFPHNLGVRPFAFGCNFICTDPAGDNSYLLDDAYPCELAQTINVSNDDELFTIWADKTNVVLVNPLDNPATNPSERIYLKNKSGVRFIMDKTKWKIQAWALKAS